MSVSASAALGGPGPGGTASSIHLPHCRAPYTSLNIDAVCEDDLCVERAGLTYYVSASLATWNR